MSDGFPLSLRDIRRTRFVGVGQQHGKLFAAVARCEISGPPQHALNGPPDRNQAFVAGHVAVPVVELLEVIHVDQHKGERLHLSCGAAHLC